MKEGDDDAFTRMQKRQQQRKRYLSSVQAAKHQIVKTRLGTPMYNVGTTNTRNSSMESNDFLYRPNKEVFDQLLGTAFPELKIKKPMSFAKWIENYIRKAYNDNLRAYGYDEHAHQIEIKSSGSRAQGYAALAAVEAGFLKLERRPIAWKFPKKLRSKFISSGPKVENTFDISSVEPTEFMDWLERTEVRANEYQVFNRYNDDISVVFLKDEHATVFKMTFAGDN
jgi:hypothetical protein